MREVPNGSIVLGDGGVITPDGGTVQCTDLCCSTEFELTCAGASPFRPDGGFVDAPIPAPAPSLSCRILPVQTPENVNFYCCACAP